MTDSNFTPEELAEANAQFEEWQKLDGSEPVDFDELESKLNSELEEQMADLEGIELDREKIGNPDSIGETIMNVVWEQIRNQVAKVAGDDFIEENYGLSLDLRNSAHIQTTENFKDGKIATHNQSIDYQKRYDGWQAKFQRNPDGSIATEHARITGEVQPKLTKDARKYLDGPKGSASMHMDHTVPAAEIIRDPAINAHLSPEEQSSFAIGDKNYKPLDAAANESKRDSKMTDWLDYERNGKKPADRFNIDEEELRERDKIAREELERLKKEGEERSIKTGKQSQKEEALRAGSKALRAVVMSLLTDLIKDIIRHLIKWFKSGKRKLDTFFKSVKKAIKSFVSNLKERLVNTIDTFFTTIIAAIWKPIVGVIKKAWMLLKQGYSSLKNAITYLKDPANKTKSFSIRMMEVGKIVIAGLTAGGAILLSEVIEKGLMTIPFLAIEIPLIGSIASLAGIFLGALVSGLIGALALNMIDRMIARQLKKENDRQQLSKGNEVLDTQDKLIIVVKKQVRKKKKNVATALVQRHHAAGQYFNDMQDAISENTKSSKNLHDSVEDTNNDINNILKTI